MLSVHVILLLAETKNSFADSLAIEAGRCAVGMPGRGPWISTLLGKQRQTSFNAVSDASAQV